MIRSYSLGWSQFRAVRLAATVAVALVTTADPAHAAPTVQIGADNNNPENPFVQPQDPAEAGGGINQTLDSGDVLQGSQSSDLQIGRLGVDVLIGLQGRDIQIGGLEHFNPASSARIFSGPGNDIVIWSPGDGSDFMDGSAGEDVLILGLLGEVRDGEPVFEVFHDEEAGEVFVDPDTGLPLLEVTNSPGFCKVIDRSGSAGAADELDALGLDHLVRFFLREQADSFEAGDQNLDNGLRQTMHLVDIEALICTSREGGAIEVLDLAQSPRSRSASSPCV
jgi:hypothetical protein